VIDKLEVNEEQVELIEVLENEKKKFFKEKQKKINVYIRDNSGNRLTSIISRDVRKS